jgi:phenylacetate-coenzyme A ligase PaaK-like adenylate-forming protein
MTPSSTETIATAGAATGNPLPTIRERLPVIGGDLDEWTRAMIRWHFSEDTGSPFWLRRRAELGFDPIGDVVDFDSLALFGLFDKNLLRRGDPRDLLPRGLRGRPFRVFETGGTTGEPCRIVNVTRMDDEVTVYEVMLEVRGVHGGDIVAMTPHGPHQYGHFVGRLADRWSGAVGYIDFDPRWVKAELRRDETGGSYVAHLVAQTKVLLERQRPALLFTTSKLLLALVADLGRPLAEFGIRAVCTGGTSCTPEEERFVKREYLEGVAWIDTYGNTLVGHALMADPLEPGQPRSYHFPSPLAVMRVADPADIARTVDIGERGRVMTTTLLEDLFLPNLLERDSAVRVGPHPWLPWDGVRDVQPYREVDGETAVEGVY